MNNQQKVLYIIPDLIKILPQNVHDYDTRHKSNASVGFHRLSKP